MRSEHLRGRLAQDTVAEVRDAFPICLQAAVPPVSVPKMTLESAVSSAVGETPKVKQAETQEAGKRENYALSNLMGTKIQTDDLVLSSGKAAEKPAESTKASSDVSPAQPDIPFAPRSAQIPFDSNTSAGMLQVPTRKSGPIRWEPPRPGTSEEGTQEGAASLAHDASQSPPSTCQPVASSIAVSSPDAEPESGLSGHSHDAALDVEMDLKATGETEKPGLEQPGPTEPKPRGNTTAQSQALAIAEAISAAAAAAGPPVGALQLDTSFKQRSCASPQALYAGQSRGSHVAVMGLQAT